ncbi:MAG: hypothetical protein KAS32_18735 [Candidatus Peribacteraceae bacterium]|nr:hypothetical protein [Candidatus Peribacteraceae bacterium]
MENHDHPKKKNPTIAVTLGYIFGPLGYLYFGWRYLVASSLIFIVIALVPTIIGYDIPSWWKYILLIPCSYEAYKICKAWNKAIEMNAPQIRLLKTSFSSAVSTTSHLIVSLGTVMAFLSGIQVAVAHFFSGKYFEATWALFFKAGGRAFIAYIIFSFISRFIQNSINKISS